MAALRTNAACIGHSNECPMPAKLRRPLDRRIALWLACSMRRCRGLKYSGSVTGLRNQRGATGVGDGAVSPDCSEGVEPSTLASCASRLGL